MYYVSFKHPRIEKVFLRVIYARRSAFILNFVSLFCTRGWGVHGQVHLSRHAGSRSFFQKRFPPNKPIITRSVILCADTVALHNPIVISICFTSNSSPERLKFSPVCPLGAVKFNPSLFPQISGFQHSLTVLTASWPNKTNEKHKRANIRLWSEAGVV